MTAENRWRTFFHAAAFVLGFSAVFVVLGASVALLGHVLNSFLPLLVKLGGLLLILFGLQTSGFLGWTAERLRRRPGEQSALARAYLAGVDKLGFLMYSDSRVHAGANPRLGYLSSLFMGVFFSAGWIPCVGPVLGAIYILASDAATVGQGALLLAAYSAGLGIPFLATGAALSSMTGWLRRLNRHLGIVSKLTGLFLVGLGILLYLDRLPTITSLLVARMGTGLSSLPLAEGQTVLTLPIALLAGLLSFLSPCVLPIIPGYIGYLSGTAINLPAAADGR